MFVTDKCYASKDFKYEFLTWIVIYGVLVDLVLWINIDQPLPRIEKLFQCCKIYLKYFKKFIFILMMFQTNKTISCRDSWGRATTITWEVCLGRNIRRCKNNVKIIENRHTELREQSFLQKNWPFYFLWIRHAGAKEQWQDH